MAVSPETFTIDCIDPELVSAFWLAFLGYEVVPNYTASIQTADPKGEGPRLLFTPAGHEKVAKNRLHLDLRPDDQDVEVSRALALGASHVEIGQTGGETWVVLADPEGNEFCILQSRSDIEALESEKRHER